MTAIMTGLSPCRRHPCSAEHAAVVDGFRQHAALWEQEAERETGGYSGDLAAYVQTKPRPLFRDWLIHSRKPTEEEAP